ASVAYPYCRIAICAHDWPAQNSHAGDPGGASGFSDRPMRAAYRQPSRAVIGSVNGRRPVTLKTRRGFDESAESERHFFSILDGAFELGAGAVTVHART